MNKILKEAQHLGPPSVAEGWNAPAKALFAWISGACLCYLVLPHFYDVSETSLIGFRLIYYLPIVFPLLILPRTIFKWRYLLDNRLFILFSMHFGFAIVSCMLGESPLTSAFITAFFYLFAILVITLLAGMPDEMRVSVLRSAGLVLIATAAVSVVIGRWKGYVSTLRYGFEIDLNPNWIGLFVSVGLLITVCCRLNPLYKILFLAIGSFALFVTGSRAAILSTLLTVSVREGTWFIGKLSKRLAISVVLVFFLSFGVGTLSGAVRGVMNQLLYQVANLAIDLLGSALGIDFFRQFRLNPELIEMGETDREDIMAALFRAYRVSFFGFGARATNVILAGLISKISHNSYASILFDYGITGFLVITCILLLSLLRIVRADIARGRKFGPEASVILCVAAFAAYHDVLLSFLSPSGIIFWISVCSAFDTSRGGKIQNGIRTWTLGKRADLGAEKGECNL